MIGVRNFDFFSSVLLSSIQPVVICANASEVTQAIASKSEVIEVATHYNSQSLCFEMFASEIFEALGQRMDTNEIDAVFCNQEANLVTARELRQMLNLVEPLDCDIQLFRHKLSMKAIVAGHGLRIPHFADELGTCHSTLAEKLDTPYIIKPCASVGSRGVFKIYQQADFDQFLAETAEDDCLYQAEEFIDGTLYHCDIVIQEGKFLFQHACQYSCPNAEFQDGKILGSFLVRPKSSLEQKLNQFSADCMKALGAPNGCFHMEVFIKKDGEPVFLEVAARSPGLSIVPIYQSWLGINLYDAELTIQMGKDATQLFEIQTDFIPLPLFYAVLPKKTGTVETLNGPEIDSQYKLNWNVKRGEVVDNTSTNLDFAGCLIVTNPCADKLVKDWDYICNMFEPITYSS